MNHLAHIYLSNQNGHLTIGNFIADFVKGNQLESFPKGIQQGIQLHRKIDAFTDQHLLFKAATKLVRPQLKKFAGIAMDIYFDHFLAEHWNHFHPLPLEQFAEQNYTLIETHWEYIPYNGRRFFSYMVAHNLLLNYKNVETLKIVFQGMHSRTKFENSLHLGSEVLAENHSELKSLFFAFFKELEDFTKNERERLTENSH